MRTDCLRPQRVYIDKDVVKECPRRREERDKDDADNLRAPERRRETPSPAISRSMPMPLGKAARLYTSFSQDELRLKCSVQVPIRCMNMWSAQSTMVHTVLKPRSLCQRVKDSEGEAGKDADLPQFRNTLRPNLR